MSTMNSTPSGSGSIPAGQGHMSEQFIGDGHKHTFDLREVPSSISAMTARVSRPGSPLCVPLRIGDLMLGTFAGGDDALVGRVGKCLSLQHALSKGERLQVEYPFDDSKQPPTVSTAPHPKAEPRNIAGWQPWDYQNWRDFAAAMREDQPIEYTMCVWLLQQESTDLAFEEGEWSRWYDYARKHCPRFDREQRAPLKGA